MRARNRVSGVVLTFILPRGSHPLNYFKEDRHATWDAKEAGMTWRRWQKKVEVASKTFLLDLKDVLEKVLVVPSTFYWT